MAQNDPKELKDIIIYNQKIIYLIKMIVLFTDEILQTCLEPNIFIQNFLHKNLVLVNTFQIC